MPKVRTGPDGLVMFWCPGCESYHGVSTDPAHPNVLTSAKWSWTGGVENPTFYPSILVRPSATLSKNPPPDLTSAELTLWCDEHRVATPKCHSFVEAGKIRFLTDCTHSLAGQTVDLREEH